MTTEEKISNEKLQHDSNRKAMTYMITMSILQAKKYYLAIKLY